MKKMIILFDRLVQIFKRKYRKSIFLAKTNCNHSHVNIVGDITLINRNIEIGRNVTIYGGVMFWGDGRIVIGDNVDIGKDTIIYSSKEGGVFIGSNTIIAGQCYIIDMDHGTKKDELIRRQPNTAKLIEIGNDCWIGANVTVLKGSKICDGAIVGAKSLVKGEIEANSVCVGIPSRCIRKRA